MQGSGIISLFSVIYGLIQFILQYKITCIREQTFKESMKKHSTFALFSEISVVEGQLSKSPERASMGSWSSAGF